MAWLDNIPDCVNPTGEDPDDHTFRPLVKKKDGEDRKTNKPTNLVAGNCMVSIPSHQSIVPLG